MTLVTLDGHGTLYEQLYRSLRAAILSGRTPPGSRLPPTRDLARELGLSRNTVLAAYSLLRGEGYAAARVGSGTYVSATLPEEFLMARDAGPPSRTSGPPPPPVLSRYARRLEEPALAAGVTPKRFNGTLYDFAYGRLAYDDFPHEAWNRVVARTHKRSSVASLSYGPPEGEAELRREIAAYLGRLRAVQCHPDQVVVVSGSRQGLT